jgi:hypothetical protein
MVDRNNFYHIQQNHIEEADISHFNQNLLWTGAKKRDNKEKEKQLDAYPQASQLDTHKNTIGKNLSTDLKSGPNFSTLQKSPNVESLKADRTDQILDEICQKRGLKRAKQRVFLSKISSHDNKAPGGATLSEQDQEDDQKAQQ